MTTDEKYTRLPPQLTHDLWHAIDGCLKNLGTDVTLGDETHWVAGWRKGRSQVAIAIREAIHPVIDRAFPAPPEQRKGLGLMSQMDQAITRQFAQRTQSMHVDRRGWSRQQWVDDARALMNHIDGAITSLVNGHVLSMLAEITALDTARHPTDRWVATMLDELNVIEPCPECSAGKHPNCDGNAWDNAADTLVPCPCAEAGHGNP